MRSGDFALHRLDQRASALAQQVRNLCELQALEQCVFQCSKHTAKLGCACTTRAQEYLCALLHIRRVLLACQQADVQRLLSHIRAHVAALHQRVVGHAVEGFHGVSAPWSCGPRLILVLQFHGLRCFTVTAATLCCKQETLRNTGERPSALSALPDQVSPYSRTSACVLCTTRHAFLGGVDQTDFVREARHTSNARLFVSTSVPALLAGAACC